MLEAQPIDLTLERMVELGLRDSYRVRRLQLEIERTRSLLRAEQAGLRSRVEMSISAPDFDAISDYKWNSTLQRNELVHENTRRWQVDLAVRQPVILFGFPTDGVLSLNNRLYRFTQLGDEERDSRYYSRYFVAYQQPLFQPNGMKIDLEEAELDLERAELEYQDNVVGIVEDLADEYYELFEYAYERDVAADVLSDLEAAAAAARELIASRPERRIELDQLQVALANAGEAVQRARSNYRLQAENIRQLLRLASTDSVVVQPVLAVQAVDVDEARAVELATSLAPRMRRLAIDRRERELDLARTRGRNAFRMNVSLSYGRETQHPEFQNLWSEPRNSYTLNVEAYVPLWDWGQRRHRIDAGRFALERSLLSAEEARSEIVTQVRNEIRNLEEYEQRALNMQANLELARQTTATALAGYRTGDVALVDLLQTIQREADTADNFLDAYMGFRNALLELEQLTHFDFASNQRLVDRYGIGR